MVTDMKLNVSLCNEAARSARSSYDTNYVLQTPPVLKPCVAYPTQLVSHKACETQHTPPYG